MIREASLWALIAARADESPEAFFALDEAGTRMTFSQYREAAERVAAGLHARGIRTDSAVSWILPTGFSALLVLAALARLGALQNPILPIYRRREVEFCLRQTRAEFLIVPTTFRGFDFGAMAEDLATELDHLQILRVDSSLPDGDPASLPKWRDSTAEQFSDPVRWIFYTSGTTSDPKGARHTDSSILLPSYGLAAAMDLGPTDRIGFVFPVTHLGGANSLIAALATGAGHLLVERFDPPSTIAFLSDHGVTHAGAGPVFHRAYLDAQRRAGPDSIFPRIRVFQGGGAQKDPQLHFDLKAEIGGMGMISVYGMTECPIVSLGRWGESDEKLAFTEGRVNLAETELRITRADGTFVSGGGNEEGEVRLRAPQLFRGYVDSSLDRDAFDAEGFYRTGDLGRVDTDGYLAISGRLKDIIIRKGENISAREVEQFLSKHPKVVDVAVIGLPDADSGERACAVVTCQDPTRPLDFDEMAGFLREAGLMVQKISTLR